MKKLIAFVAKLENVKKKSIGWEERVEFHLTTYKKPMELKNARMW